MVERVRAVLTAVWNHERPLSALVLAFFVLGAVYSVATPIFEAGDEVWHYPFVQWLATGHGLPVQDAARKEPWEQEGGQPPLYYALTAASTFWIDTADLPERLWRNPYARVGIPLAPGNKNLVVHTDAESFPWQGTTLAVHLARLLSLLMGAVTVVLTVLTGRDVFAAIRGGRSLAWIAGALVAFNPMFLFISASVNNDNLATMLAALALLLIVQLVTRGPDARRLFALGLVLGLAALSKVSDLALLPLAGPVVTWLAWRGRDWRLWIRGAVFLAVPAALIAGWWYVRNWVLYGDPLALNVWLQISGGRAPVTLLGLLDEFQGFRISFWGNFGGVNLIAPDWVYLFLDLVTLVAALGLFLALVSRRWPRTLWVAALWVGLIVASLVRWTLMTYASQGRLIFPAISAVALLFAFGLGETGRLLGSALSAFSRIRHRDTRVKELVPGSALFGLALFALAAPFLIICPAYELPSTLPAGTEVPNPAHITFRAEGNPELAGYEIGRSAPPGGLLPVTLYWSSSDPVSEDLYVYIHLYSRQGDLIGQWDALPGNGLYPPRLWRPGQLVIDKYEVPVQPYVEGPQVGRVEIGLARVGTVIPLPASDPEGREVNGGSARFKIAGKPVPSRTPSLARFGDSLDLTRLEVFAKRGITEFQVAPPRAGALDTPLAAGDRVRVDVGLKSRIAPSKDFKVFVHLVDAGGRILAQQDEEPQGGDYPTSFWDAGEEVNWSLELSVPENAQAGECRIEFGIYGADDQVRLAVSGAGPAGWTAASDHLVLGPLPLQQ